MCYAVPGPASKLCPQSLSEALWMFAYRQTGRTSLSFPCYKHSIQYKILTEPRLGVLHESNISYIIFMM